MQTMVDSIAATSPTTDMDKARAREETAEDLLMCTGRSAMASTMVSTRSTSKAASKCEEVDAVEKFLMIF